MNSKGIDCLGDNGVCISVSTRSVKVVKKQTRADVIRSMSDEELADFIEMKQFFALANNGTDGEEYTLKWLQSEAEQQKGAICGKEKCLMKTTE